MTTELIHGDCIEEMAKMDANSIDLTVTSPPYDNLRTYEGSLQWNEDIWKQVLEGLYRVTKQGGVVVWVVGDATIKGSETGTSFKQALYAMECGFNLHDTMIYRKGGMGACGSNLCYLQDFEYMFVLSKGKPTAINLIRDRENKAKATIRSDQGSRRSCGGKSGGRANMRKKMGRRFNIWKYHETSTRVNHPAVFPEQLAHDHIISWSNEGDTVFDPFLGSGTTGLAAKNLNRNFIGIEKVDKYYEIAMSRIFDDKHTALLGLDSTP